MKTFSLALSAIIGATSVLALFGCKNGTLQSEVPAVIVDPTPASRAELREVVSTALNGAQLTLADNALTDNSTLVIERQPQRDPRGNRLPGRIMEAPERFHLRLSGGNCVLVRESTDQRWELREVDCIASD